MIYSEIEDDVIVIDTETTGVDVSTDEIIEFSYRTSTEAKTFRFNTTIEIDAGASAIHFITNDDLVGLPTFAESARKIYDILIQKKYISGHNLNFDMSMIISEFKRTGQFTENELLLISVPEIRICTLELSKKLYAENNDFQNLKLSYLWFKLGLNKTTSKKIVPHSAEDDVFMCNELLKHNINTFSKEIGTDDIDTVLQEVAKPTLYKIMPFGKYKGELISNVPLSYIEWLMLNSEILDETRTSYDKDIAYSLTHEWSKRKGL